MIDFTRLRPPVATAWAVLTFPPYRELLADAATEGLEMVGASDHDQPVGLAVARFDPDEPRVAEVMSLAVAAAHRGRGLGGELLARLEAALAARGARRLTAVYATPTASSAVLEHLLQRQGWARPEPRMALCLSTTERIRQAPWVWSCMPPDGFELVGWDLVGAGERAVLAGSLAGLGVPEVLDPFAEPDLEEPTVSVVLRRAGRIVAWMITHRTPPDTIRYSRLFVPSELRRRGLGLPLVAAALRRHLSGPLDHEAPYGRWTLRLDNPLMVNQLRRRLQPYLVSVTVTKGTYKLLPPPEGSA